MSGGRVAVASGQKLEEDFRNLVASFRFKIKKYSQYNSLTDPEVLLCNVPYTTIYGTKGRSEYLLKSKRYNINCRIECKEQNVGGSVDEKFPYLLENCINAFPERSVIIIYRGKGFREGSISWMQKRAAECQTKDIKVLSLAEFNLYMNKKQLSHSSPTR